MRWFIELICVIRNFIQELQQVTNCHHVFILLARVDSNTREKLNIPPGSFIPPHFFNLKIELYRYMIVEMRSCLLHATYFISTKRKMVIRIIFKAMATIFTDDFLRCFLICRIPMCAPPRSSAGIATEAATFSAGNLRDGFAAISAMLRIGRCVNFLQRMIIVSLTNWFHCIPR